MTVKERILTIRLIEKAGKQAILTGHFTKQHDKVKRGNDNGKK